VRSTRSTQSRTRPRGGLRWRVRIHVSPPGARAPHTDLRPRG
jgi:hypothetical protein